MTDRLTPEALRQHAKAPETAFWVSQARQLLKWAADLIEAADAVVGAVKASEATTCNHPPDARGLTGCLICGATL